MNAHLPDRRDALGKQMGVEVAAEQSGLEKQQTRGPDLGRAAEPGQDFFGDQRLRLKQKERAEEDGRARKNPPGVEDERLRQRLSCVFDPAAHRLVISAPWDARTL